MVVKKLRPLTAVVFSTAAYFGPVAELEAPQGVQHPICNRENVGSSPTRLTAFLYPVHARTRKSESDKAALML